MKKKNGFTLIELLAVIVILAMITLIIVPIVMNVIEKAKIGAAESGAVGYLDAFEKQIALAQLKGNEYPDGVYAIGGTFISKNPVSYKGTGPSKGKMVIEKQRVVSAELCINHYPIDYKNGIAKYNGQKNTCDKETVFEDDNEIVLTGKLKVSGAITSDTTGFFGSTIQRKDVEEIVTTNTNVVPSNVVESLDVSQEGNGSIMAWFLDTDGNGKYELYIGQKGRVNLSSGYHLFSYFTNVKRVDLSYLDTSATTDMSYMFHVCMNLNSLDLTKLDTTNVTDMKYMFNSCRSLTDLDLSHFNTRNVTDMKYMFNGCRGFTTMNLSHFDTNELVYMDGMFNGCSGLTSLNISNFNVKKVTSMGLLFSNCEKLVTLNLGEFNIAKVSKYNYMFRFSSNLATVKTTSATTKTWLEARLSEDVVSAIVVLES